MSWANNGQRASGLRTENRRGRAIASLGRPWQRRWGLGAMALSFVVVSWLTTGAQAQTRGGGTLTLRSDVQEANAATGVITARGNVQIDYPAQGISATAAQAQYFDQERRIILSGNVIVNQEGNRLEAETVTYLIDEGRFIALPQPQRQVRATYRIRETDAPPPGPASGAGTPSDPVTVVTPDDSLLLSPLQTGRSTPPQ